MHRKLDEILYFVGDWSNEHVKSNFIIKLEVNRNFLDLYKTKYLQSLRKKKKM